nr:retrotransposon protein, putative, unclassified [Tanacetum cinerariifolium]
MALDHVSSDPIPQCPTTALEQTNLSPGPKIQQNVPQAAKTVTTSNELDLLFSLMFDELLNGTTPLVSKSFTVTAADAPDQSQQHNTTPSTSTTIAANTPPLNIQTTREEVYVNQPDGFVHPHHPDKVYRLKKVLYGLKQAPRAWYDELSNFLVSKGFSKGSIDPTLFITKKWDDILRVRIYVDDIIFDSDHAGCLDSCKSTSGGIQFLGGDKLVSWSSKKQEYTSMSTAEAEYVSLSTCCAQVLWLRTQRTDYGFHFNKIPMYCDSQAAIAISYNSV